MKKYIIISGNFTEAGNFSGYTAEGERIHFFKRQMESAGIDPKKPISYPLFCTATVKQIGQLDENGDPKMENGEPVTVDRLTAGAVWADRKAMVEVLANADDRLLTGSINKRVAEIAQEEGLTADTMRELESQASQL